MTPQKFNKAMGAAVRRLRNEHGFNQAVLGDAIGVTYQQIQKGESGTNAFSAFQLTKLVGLLNVTIAQLYEQVGFIVEVKDPSPAQNDSFMAARYVGRIEDAKLRGVIVDFTRKLAYQTGGAA